MVSLRSAVRKLAILGVVVLVVGGGAAGYAAATFDRPQVQSVDAGWGAVGAETTEIETTVVVDNPNSYGVPPIATVGYTARMNDVVIAEGREGGVGLGPGRNEITIGARLDHEAIAEWWVTHINNGERSTLDVDATVSAVGISRTIDVSEDVVETDLLGPMRTGEPRTVRLRGEEFVVLKEQSAAWGEATAEETPVTVSATVENRHDAALTLDGLAYVVRMNNVTVGEGQRTENVSVAPGGTGTIDVTAIIDTPKLADWWATHVRNNETTTMSVAMYGLVERDGELKRVPFALFERDLRFRTALLAGGTTQVEALAGDDGGPSYEQPEVLGTERRWGRVTDSTTEIVATVTVDNPNEGRINEFVGVEVGQTVAINGVTVADGSAALGPLAPGVNDLQASVPMDNAKVPRWWARHVNNGEQSTVVVRPRATADLGFTTFDVPVQEQRSTVRTDVLAGLESDQRQEVTVDGQRVAVIHGTRAEWKQADAQASPFVVRVTVENTAPAPLTVEAVDYRIAMNDVVVADRTAPESHTIPSGETRTVAFTLVIDSQKMDEWWVSHVRNGETTTLAVDATATVSAAGQSSRVSLDSLTTNSTVETDFLGQDG